MIQLYTIFNLITVILGKRAFKQWFNPITIYAIVWEIPLLLHQSGFIYYYDMTLYTWFVIMFSQVCFTFSSCVGFSITDMRRQKELYFNEELFKRELFKYILITLIISGVAILANLAVIISIYGTNLFATVTDVYYDRVNEEIDLQKIPYLGQIIFVTLPMLGIYVKRFGFSLLLIPAIILVCLNSFTSGGRAGIAFSLLLILFGYLLTPKVKRKQKNKSNRGMIWLLICVAALAAMIIKMSEIRSAISTNQYATQLYKNIFGDNTTIFKTISYFSNPVATLNEYLKVENFSFGRNTFLPIYNILAKFGFMERPEQYQEWFYTPMGCNVGTWQRELTQDFTIIGCIIVVSLFGLLTAMSFGKALKESCISHKIVCSVLLMAVALSFFDWRLRTSNTWIALFCGYYIGKKIEKKCCLKYDRRFNA